MRVFVAGATGALGRPLVTQLIERGHNVVGMTRRASRADALRELGAEAVVADALDARAVKEAVAQARADVVVHALTALPAGGPRRVKDLRQTNALRTRGTTNLLEASRAAGVKRFVAESIVLVYGSDPQRVGREATTPRAEGADTLPAPPGMREGVRDALDALTKLEEAVAAATADGIAGVSLRYGLFYGTGTSTDVMARQLRRRQFALPRGELGRWSWIHIEDAAAATVRAVEDAPAGAIYNVVDDEPVAVDTLVDALADVLGVRGPWKVPPGLATVFAPYAVAMAMASVAASNERIRSELGWAPAFPTYREGLRHSYTNAK